MDAEFQNHLDASYQEALNEQRIIANLETALSKSIRLIINQQFPDDIMNLSAEAYRELERTVCNYACKAAIDICNVMYDDETTE